MKFPIFKIFLLQLYVHLSKNECFKQEMPKTYQIFLSKNEKIIKNIREYFPDRPEYIFRTNNSKVIQVQEQTNLKQLEIIQQLQPILYTSEVVSLSSQKNISTNITHIALLTYQVMQETTSFYIIHFSVNQTQQTIKIDRSSFNPLIQGKKQFCLDILNVDTSLAIMACYHSGNITFRFQSINETQFTSQIFDLILLKIWEGDEVMLKYKMYRYYPQNESVHNSNNYMILHIQYLQSVDYISKLFFYKVNNNNYPNFLKQPIIYVGEIDIPKILIKDIKIIDGDDYIFLLDGQKFIFAFSVDQNGKINDQFKFNLNIDENEDVNSIGISYQYEQIDRNKISNRQIHVSSNQYVYMYAAQPSFKSNFKKISNFSIEEIVQIDDSDNFHTDIDIDYIQFLSDNKMYLINIKSENIIYKIDIIYYQKSVFFDDFFVFFRQVKNIFDVVLMKPEGYSYRQLVIGGEYKNLQQNQCIRITASSFEDSVKSYCGHVDFNVTFIDIFSSKFYDTLLRGYPIYYLNQTFTQIPLISHSGPDISYSFLIGNNQKQTIEENGIIFDIKSTELFKLQLDPQINDSLQSFLFCKDLYTFFISSIYRKNILGNVDNIIIIILKCQSDEQYYRSFKCEQYNKIERQIQKADEVRFFRGELKFNLTSINQFGLTYMVQNKTYSYNLNSNITSILLHPNIILMKKFSEINFFVYSNKNDEKFLKVTSNEFDLNISIKSDIDQNEIIKEINFMQQKPNFVYLITNLNTYIYQINPLLFLTKSEILIEDSQIKNIITQFGFINVFQNITHNITFLEYFYQKDEAYGQFSRQYQLFNYLIYYDPSRNGQIIDAFSHQSGNYYILGYSQDFNETRILIYKSHQQSIDQLRKTILLPLGILDKQDLLNINFFVDNLTINGNLLDYVSIRIKDKQYLLTVPQTDNIFIYSKNRSLNQNCFDANITVQTTSFDKIQKDQVLYQTSLINSYINIAINQNKLSQIQNSLIVFKNQPSIKIDTNDIFIGSVPQIKIDCKDCKYSSIKLINQVQKTITYQNFTYDVLVNSEYKEILTLEKGVFNQYDQQMNLQYSLDISLENLICYKILPNSNYILICKNQENNLYYTIKLKRLVTNRYSICDKQLLQFVDQIYQVFFDQGILIVLPKEGPQNKDGGFYIFNLTSNEQNLIPVIITNNSLNLQYLIINSFKLLQNHIYFIYDYTPVIYRFEMNRTDYNVIENSLIFINLQIAWQNLSSYFQFNSQTKIIDFQIIQKDQLDLNLYMLTNNKPLYDIKLSYQNNNCTLKLNNFYAGYGDFMPQKNFIVTNNYIIIQYYDQKETNLIAVYKNKQNKSSIYQEPIFMMGGSFNQYKQQYQPFLQFIQSQNIGQIDKILALSKNQQNITNIQLIEINNNESILIKNTTSLLSRQSIKFNTSSYLTYLNKQEISFERDFEDFSDKIIDDDKSDEEENKKQDRDKKFTLTLILTILIPILVIFLIFIGYNCYKKINIKFKPIKIQQDQKEFFLQESEYVESENQNQSDGIGTMIANFSDQINVSQKRQYSTIN